MKAFIAKHHKNIIGVLSGWDRIVFRGTFRLVANLAGMHQYLSYLGILMKDFKQYAQEKTAELIGASVGKAERAGRPNLYLPSARTNKESIALEIAQRDGITKGLICILRTVEPCMTYQLHRNRKAKTLDLQVHPGKCMHLYHYWYDAYFGFMGARIQTWFPFAIQLWMNGREWLARRLDQEGPYRSLPQSRPRHHVCRVSFTLLLEQSPDRVGNRCGVPRPCGLGSYLSSTRSRIDLRLRQ